MISRRMWKYLSLVAVVVVAALCMYAKSETPVLYIIGDSTVRNGDGSGRNKQWGWGSFIDKYFDTTCVAVRNHAIGGRSSRTFITEGRWERILETLKPGDFVIMQFGHNDSGPLDDTARARGTIKGIGTEEKEVYNPIMKKQELVHTYGWYMRKYVDETKARGATPIICSPIPRNVWKDGNVERSKSSYAGWAEQVAKENGALFIDLNELVSQEYEKLGSEAVAKFFPADHTHTDKAGAELNTAIVMTELKKLKLKKLNKCTIRP